MELQKSIFVTKEHEQAKTAAARPVFGRCARPGAVCPTTKLAQRLFSEVFRSVNFSSETRKPQSARMSKS